MTDWDGKRWISEGAAAHVPSRGSIAARVLGATAEAGLITLLVFGLIAGTTFAAKGGNGGKPLSVVSTCVVDGNVVRSTSLPTDEIVNFLVTDESGTSGWVLGFTLEGWWNVNVPDRNGPTTYQFVSRTWGNGGSRYQVFDSCTAS